MVCLVGAYLRGTGHNSPCSMRACVSVSVGRNLFLSEIDLTTTTSGITTWPLEGTSSQILSG